MLPIILLLISALLALYHITKRIGIQRVEYRRHFSEEGVFEGETVVLVEEIINRAFLPFIRVDINAYLTHDLRLDGYPLDEKKMQCFTSRFFLLPFMQIKRSIRITCMKRGYYQLETVLINNTWRDAGAVLHVYPRALPYGDENPMNSDIQNTANVDRRLLHDPFSFSGIRDYRYGDAFRNINYKATAKTGLLKVNNRDYFSNRNIMVYIDFSQLYPQPLTTEVYTDLMERALSYTANMVEAGIKQGFNVGFAANCRMFGRVNRANHAWFPMGRGHNHYMGILKEMAVIRMRDGCSFTWLLIQQVDVLWNTDIYIMTTNTELPLDDVVGMYESRGNNVTVLFLDNDRLKV